MIDRLIFVFTSLKCIMFLAVMNMMSYRLNRVKGHVAHAVVHTGPEVED